MEALESTNFLLSVIGFVCCVAVACISKIISLNKLVKQSVAKCGELEAAHIQIQIEKADLESKLQETSVLYSQSENARVEAQNKIKEADDRFTSLNMEYQRNLNELNDVRTQLQQNITQCNLLTNHTNDLKENTRSLETLNKAFNDKNTLLENTISETNAKLTDALENINKLTKEKETANSEIAALQAKLQANVEINNQVKAQFEISQKQLKDELTNISEKFVKLGTEDLSKKSQNDLKTIVNPLREELDKFKNMMNENHAKQEKRAGAFENELKNIHESSITLSNQASELAKALRSGSKSQGMWGELQLERVLESSGLVKDKDYKREVAVKPDSDEITKTGRPDAVVYLPENHCVIIDAKCSLTAYTVYINATEPEEKEKALKAHIDSIRKHVKELKDKGYCDNYRKVLNSPSFVFMFVPLDGALQDALINDSTLYDEAAESKIYLVSPSSMIPALRVVANLWILSEQSQRVSDLVHTAQNIWDKFATIENKMVTAIKYNNSLTSSLSDLESSLYTGRGNLKSKLQKFDKAGSRNKQLESGTTIDSDAVLMEDDSNNFVIEEK